MSTLTLPVQVGVPAQQFRVSLDGELFLVAVTWNEREGAWYLDLSDADGTVLLAGRKLVLGQALLARFRDARLPPGELLVLDTTGSDLEPGPQDLGARVPLFYVEATSLPAPFAT